MNLSTPETVRKLREALHAKAKGEPGYRFYALYDKLYRKDILTFAYQCCKANGGAAGVDGQGFEEIERYGVERWLGELANDADGRADFPHPALGQDFTPSPTARRAQACTGVRARSARKGAGVDRSRPCAA